MKNKILFGLTLCLSVAGISGIASATVPPSTKHSVASKSQQLQLAAKAPQAVYAITAGDAPAGGGGADIELPEIPPDPTPVPKKFERIHPYGAKINYDSKLWFLLFLMPVSSAYFLLSAARAYIKTRKKLENGMSKDCVKLARTKMGE